MTAIQRRRTVTAVVSVAVIAAVIVLALNYVASPDMIPGSLEGLEASDSLTLYSLDGRTFPPGKEPQTAEKCHDVPVLGKIEITDANVREKVIRDLKWGVAHGESYGAACFWPRHGIRAKTDDKTVDLVICFECGWIYIYHDGDESHETTRASSHKLLNKLLADAGIPLAPDGGMGP